jgi:hypothetical protein
MNTLHSTQGSNRSKPHAKTGPVTYAARVQEDPTPLLEDPAPLHVESSSMKRGKLPPPPDVQEVARRGGLPADILGYKLGPNWSLQSGNSTPEFNHYLILGFDKLLDDVRYYCEREGRDVPQDEIRAEFSNVAFASDGLLTDARLGTAKGKDLFNEQRAIEPRPGEWAPKAPQGPKKPWRELFPRVPARVAIAEAIMLFGKRKPMEILGHLQTYHRELIETQWEDGDSRSLDDICAKVLSKLRKNGDLP